MKRYLATGLALCLMLLALAGCSDNSSSSSSQSSGGQSASPPVSSVGGSSLQNSPSTDSSTAGAHDVEALLPGLVEAAGLGGTIKVETIDLGFGGVDTDNIVALAGAESQTSSQNGGIVLVIQTQPGKADTVAQDLEAYKQSRLGNEDYAEFAQARENTGNARIVKNGDYVIYAVSATGDWTALDDALANVFA